MKTTIENLLKIEGSELHTSETNGVSLIFLYKTDSTEIYYKFYGKPIYEPTAHIMTYDECVVDLHFFETIEDVLNQLYYITGEKIKLKND